MLTKQINKLLADKSQKMKQCTSRLY